MIFTLNLHSLHRVITLLLFVTISICVSTNLTATHNRAGEITYEQIDELTIRATIVTYTRTSSQDADRDSLTLHWGDGDSTVVQRVNGNGFELPNDIKRNEYVGIHTYPTRGTYTMSVVDPNRIQGILNIDFPNSINIKFYIETTFTLLEPRFQGVNNSAILLQPPIDFACVGRPYTYNPNAYEPDGDSLSYELVTPLADNGMEVPNYQLPDQINAGPDNTIELNPITGDFVWTSPQTQGEYNITYLIKEYREGVLINTILRDMQILVRACIDTNNPPTVDVPEEICVIAGETIIIDIEAMDIDSNEILSITASGGPFELQNSSAALSVDNALPDSKLSGQIIWTTTCDQISNEYYQIVVRASDELSRPMTSGLAALKTIRIRVVGPPPSDLVAENVNNTVTLNWRKPYDCENGSRFQGFSVWRRLGSSTISIDECRPGLEGQGFEKIVFLTNEMNNGRYFAIDAEIDPGNIYCYRIVAEFAQITQQGNLYNRSQSLPSEEFCIRSSGDHPLITNVSVDETDVNNGRISIAWLNPDAQSIDTSILIGPYGLSILGGEGFSSSSLSLVQEFNYPSGRFNSIDDTSAMQSMINTLEGAHSYQVEFSSGSNDEEFKTISEMASSVFLSSSGGDERIQLTWNENVPWNNYQYLIFDISSGESVLIDSTPVQNYMIQDLINGQEMCYRVQSLGTFGISEVPDPLINFSNESCATPRDNEAPCPPESITIESICDNTSLQMDENLLNTISWTFSGSSCEIAQDVSSFIIYFSEENTMELNVLAEVSADQRSFEHDLEENIAGCYAISAVDSSGNESVLSEIFCIDNCPTYILPNTFTPNNDQSNDLFVPRFNRFIDRIELIVYNRWGQKVFETIDPAINWDGKNLQNSDLSEGTYFYECKVFEKRVSGIIRSEDLTGTIQLIR